jgi:hypothetical protein
VYTTREDLIHSTN